jgi:hypothetical protein
MDAEIRARYDSARLIPMITPLFLAAAETVGATSLISVLIWLLVLAVVVYVIWLILNMLPLPEPIRTIILCILGLVLLLVIVQRLGFF